MDSIWIFNLTASGDTMTGSRDIDLICLDGSK